MTDRWACPQSMRVVHCRAATATTRRSQERSWCKIAWLWHNMLGNRTPSPDLQRCNEMLESREGETAAKASRTWWFQPRHNAAWHICRRNQSIMLSRNEFDAKLMTGESATFIFSGDIKAQTQQQNYQQLVWPTICHDIVLFSIIIFQFTLLVLAENRHAENNDCPVCFDWLRHNVHTPIMRQI